MRLWRYFLEQWNQKLEIEDSCRKSSASFLQIKAKVKGEWLEEAIEIQPNLRCSCSRQIFSAASTDSPLSLVSLTSQQSAPIYFPLASLSSPFIPYSLALSIMRKNEHNPPFCLPLSFLASFLPIFFLHLPIIFVLSIFQLINSSPRYGWIFANVCTNRVNPVNAGSSLVRQIGKCWQIRGIWFNLLVKSTEIHIVVVFDRCEKFN